MLIDLSNYGMLTIDPTQYPDTLVVAIDAPNDKTGCGVFAGRHDFKQEEREQPIPPIQDQEEDFGLKLFALERPSRASEHLIQRWYYAAIGWDGGVYVGYPYAYEIILEELSPNPGDDSGPYWNVMVSGPRGSFRLVLPSYKPKEES